MADYHSSARAEILAAAQDAGWTTGQTTVRGVTFLRGERYVYVRFTERGTVIHAAADDSVVAGHGKDKRRKVLDLINRKD